MENVGDLLTVSGPAGEQRRQAAHEAGVTGTQQVLAPPGALKELHVCMGLNACKGHAVDGSGDMAGMGNCATVAHVCHGSNNCRGQGGCGYAGSDVEQSKPGNQDCKWNGSCASPINQSRTVSAGPAKGTSVWKLARALFEQRMYAAGVPFGPSPGEGYPDDLVPGYEDGYKGCGA